MHPRSRLQRLRKRDQACGASTSVAILIDFGWLLLAAMLLLGLQSMPARSDVLVTVAGEQIATQGPWEVQGRRIVYTNAEGTLTAIRTARVDLPASERVTEEKRGPKPRKRYGSGPIEEHPDLVAVAEQTEASRNGEASLVLESDTAAGPRADLIGAELSRLFESVSLDTASKARLKNYTFSAIRRLADAVERHDVTTVAGTRALAPELHDIAGSLRRASREESNRSVRFFFRYVAGQIQGLAYAAERGPAALAEEL